jgi:hypothetical protein
VTRAYADKAGAVHIVKSSGKEIVVRKERGASGVEDVKVAADGQTVGWLIDWPNPDANRKWELIPGELVI